jgi:hypothetical protein
MKKPKLQAKAKEKDPEVIIEMDGFKLYKGINEGGRALFLRTHYGTAKSGDLVFDLDTNWGNGGMIVTNKKTGRMLTFSWQGMLNMGEKLGLMAEVKKPKKKRR